MADRTLVFVKVSNRSTWFYGFGTSLDDADRQALGHTTYAPSSTGVVFGVNSPKPARMKKVKSSGETVTSFVNYATRGEALTAGWKLVKRARARVSRPTTRNVPVYVSMENGGITVKYAWNMRKTLYDALGNTRSQLGISDVSTESDPFDLVWGARLEVPRAINQATGQSTFYGSTIASLPDGWSGVGGLQE